MFVTIYNDGEVAVQLFREGGMGSIKRVHTINGRVVEQASKAQFLADMPVCQGFIDDVSKADPKFWAEVQKDLREILRSRNVIL